MSIGSTWMHGQRAPIWSGRRRRPAVAGPRCWLPVSTTCCGACRAGRHVALRSSDAVSAAAPCPQRTTGTRQWWRHCWLPGPTAVRELPVVGTLWAWWAHRLSRLPRPSCIHSACSPRRGNSWMAGGSWSQALRSGNAAAAALLHQPVDAAELQQAARRLVSPGLRLCRSDFPAGGASDSFPFSHCRPLQPCCCRSRESRQWWLWWRGPRRRKPALAGT